MRKSNFEALRLMSVFAIIYMHLFGTIIEKVQGINELAMLFENSLFNVGVTCFVLIAGYFGVRFDICKIIKIDLAMILYSVISLAINASQGGLLPREYVVGSFLPVISGKNWFVTSYIFLLIMSPYLNKIQEKSDKEFSRKLILSLITLFYIIPTFFYFELLKDGGKGFVHMCIIYLIGRHISLYGVRSIKKKWLFVGFIVSVNITWILNILTLKYANMKLIFSRDCSLTILVSAVLLFLLFRQVCFQNQILNFLSSNSLFIIMGEGVARYIIDKMGIGWYFDLNKYIDEWYLSVVVLIYAILVIIFGIIINQIRILILGKTEDFCIIKILMLYDNVKIRFNKRIKKIKLDSL